MDSDLLSGSLDVRNALRCWNYKRKFHRDNPEYFDPEGLLVFCGSQRKW